MGRIVRWLWSVLYTPPPETEDDLIEGMARNLEAESKLWGRVAVRSESEEQKQHASEMKRARAGQASRLRSRESVLIEGLFGVAQDQRGPLRNVRERR